jgi:hypothetical protein
MTIQADRLAALGFVETHELQRTAEGRLRFRVLDGVVPSGAAGVYAWVAAYASAPAGSLHVLYVGKAGRGICARLGQHEGGFQHSGTGRDNARRLAVEMEAGARISVFARTSDTALLFGQRVSLYAAEEDALCRLLKPSFNRAEFPEFPAAAA